MKIYFTASLTGKKLYKKNYKKIVSYLEELGCKVYSEHIFKSTKKQICNETKEERIAYNKLLNKNLKWCDALISEVSYPSTATGYEICLGISKGKPAVALYLGKKENYPPILKALRQEDASLLKYNMNNLKTVLETCIDFLKESSLEKRFTMILPPNITSFLDKLAYKEKTSRSDYIRKLIENDMKLRRPTRFAVHRGSTESRRGTSAQRVTPVSSNTSAKSRRSLVEVSSKTKDIDRRRRIKRRLK